jgi:monoamine oxidase
VTEWCGELIDSPHATIRGLVSRFGLATKDLAQAEPPGSEPTYFFDGKYYPLSEATKDFVPVLTLVQADAKAAVSQTKSDGSPNTDGTVVYNALTPRAIELDNMSVHEWIARNVGSKSTLGRLLDAAYCSELGAETMEQSALNLVLMLSGAPDSNFVPFGASDERFHIIGGNQRLPLAMAEYLGPSIVKRHQRLESIARECDGTYALGFDGKDVVADHVILTVPFAVLADSIDHSGAGFDDLKRTAIKELGRGRCSKLQLQFTRRLWAEGGHEWGKPNNGEETFSDNGDQCSWEATRGQMGAHGIINGYSGGHLTDKRAEEVGVAFAKGGRVRPLAEKLRKQLDQIFPGIAGLWNEKA